MSETDVNELFSRDPLKLTDDCIDKIIAEYRKRRAMFQAGPTAEKKEPKLTKAQQQASSLKIDLDL